MINKRENAIGYLFGELSGDELESFENEIFSDEDLALFVADVENELVDDYSAGRLDAAVKIRFEKGYLTSARRRQKVETSSILANLSEAEPRTAVEPRLTLTESILQFFRRPGFAIAAGLCLLLLFLFAGILLTRSPSPEPIAIDVNAPENPTNDNSIPFPTIRPDDDLKTPEKTPVNAPANQNRNDQTPVKTTSPDKVKPEGSRVFAALLVPMTRSGSSAVFALPETVREVRLSLANDDESDFGLFRVEIRNSRDESVYVRTLKRGRGASNRAVSVSVDRKLLPSGTYEVSLTGIDSSNQPRPIGFYGFTIR